MLKPRRLTKGDRVRIVAPASPVKPEMFEGGVRVVKEMGFEPKYKDPFQKWRYLAGQDSHRKAELLEALQDQDSSAIFFARGGYGCARLIPDKNFEQSFTPKILLGSSDITTLLLYFQKVHNWVVFHGPMPSGDFSRGQLHRESLLLALTSDKAYQLNPSEVECLESGEAEGILAGGCLTLIDESLKTPWEPEWSDTILFLEDVSVKPYQIDRMLMHLIHSKKLDGVRAFIFGEMKDCFQVENQGYTLQEVIMDILGPLGKPIYFGFPSGHVSGLNWTIPFGIRSRISSKGLEILESPCS
jgi:muramoyltetrapeptide carboxypeptidase